MKKTKDIKAVLFDMDGVLVDSEAYIREAAIQMFSEKGHSVSEGDFMPFTGMGENRYLGGVAEKHHIPFDLESDKRRTYEIYADLVHGKLEEIGMDKTLFQAIVTGLDIELKKPAPDQVLDW